MGFETDGFVKIENAIPSKLLCTIPDESARNPFLPDGLIEVTRQQLWPYLPDAKLVRSTLFSKSGQNSWSLGWHQDRVIAVKEQHDMTGYSLWSRKSGYWHVEPPLPVLERMVFVQIYCDKVSGSDGPTELAVGSHGFGKVMSEDIEAITSNCRLQTLTANAGDMVICKALILHRSLASESKSPRRIFRLDLSDIELPKPLKWAGSSAHS